MTGKKRFLAVTAPGLQPLLAEELRDLGLDPAIESSGAAVIQGDWDAAARVLIRSRIASRIGLSLRRFSARNRAMLYDQIRRIDWPALFPNTLTFSVEAMGSVRGSDFTLSYAPLRIKDAVCDQFRKRGLDRPNVDRRNPDVPLRAFFWNGRCEISIDLSGEPLHKRGYRTEGAEAPIRENRAAALLAFCGFDGSRPFLDPFCGSGTLVVEAALIAGRIAPGLLRKPEGYTASRISPEAAAAIAAEVSRAGKERCVPSRTIRGSDLHPEVLDTARANAERAGVADWVGFTPGDARGVEAADHWIVSNPPYGERLEDPAAAAALLGEFVHRVKHHAVGSRLGLVLPRGPLENAVGLRPDRKLNLESGSMGLRFLCYDIQAGRFDPGLTANP